MSGISRINTEPDALAVAEVFVGLAATRARSGLKKWLEEIRELRRSGPLCWIVEGNRSKEPFAQSLLLRLPDDLGYLFRDAILDVGRPEHLWDVDSQKDGCQEDGLNGGDTNVLDPLAAYGTVTMKSLKPSQ